NFILAEHSLMCPMPWAQIASPTSHDLEDSHRRLGIADVQALFGTEGNFCAAVDSGKCLVIQRSAPWVLISARREPVVPPVSVNVEEETQRPRNFQGRKNHVLDQRGGP